jgi:hypothetical protein
MHSYDILSTYLLPQWLLIPRGCIIGLLWDVRYCLKDRLHWTEVVWLMQRCQRNQPGQIIENLLVELNRCSAFHAAAHDAMPTPRTGVPFVWIQPPVFLA